MTTATPLYTVTDRAGPRVAGRLVKHGDLIALTGDEAEYELRVGTIVPSGTAPPVVTPPAAILPTDVLTIRRGSVTRECTVADLLALVGSPTGSGGSAGGRSLDFSDPSNSGHLPGIGG